MRALLVLCLTLAALVTVDWMAAPSADATSQGDCVRGEPEPLLAAAPGKPKPAFRRTGPREAIETLRIDPATRLTIRHFGCAHFAMELTFVTRAGGPKKPAGWFSWAAERLERVPVAPDQRQIVRQVVRRLRQAATERNAFATPLQISETAALSVELHRGRSETRLVLLYEVTL